jgi:hypothetical protein
MSANAGRIHSSLVVRMSQTGDCEKHNNSSMLIHVLSFLLNPLTNRRKTVAGDNARRNRT